jgi:hypothetical protein
MEAAFGGGSVQSHRLDDDVLPGADLVFLSNENGEALVALPDQEQPLPDAGEDLVIPERQHIGPVPPSVRRRSRAAPR